MKRGEGNPSSSRQSVSALGAEIIEEIRRLKMAPKGSAVLTCSGRLAASGITAVVHAATGAMSQTGPLFDPTLQSVAASVANALVLAGENGHVAVAIPFIGGKIFQDRIGVAPETLSSAIVEAIAKNRRELTVKIVAFGTADAELFQRVLGSFPEARERISVVEGSITDFKTHGCSAIVNAANMELRFGGGVSGAIAKATGTASEIEQEAARKLEEFYIAIKG